MLFVPFLFLLVPGALAQENVPEFSVDVVSLRSEESPAMSRVDVYARVQYPDLSFINTPNGFTASYEIALSVVELSDTDRLRNIVKSPIWDGNVVTDTYIKTQADDRSDFTTQSIDLPPGRYVFEFELTDKNSSQVYVSDYPVSVKSFSAPTTISDLTLLETYDADSFTIVPRVDPSVYTTDGGVQLFYEVYTDAARDITVRKEIFRTLRDGGIPAAPAMLGLSGGEGNAAERILNQDELTQLPTGRSQHLVTIPMDEVKAGGYVVRISLIGADGEALDSASRGFYTHWSGLAAHIQDIDDAIQQLEYIAKKKDLNFIREGADKVERFERFQKFWEKRDPTPNTRRNESMEEYYYRVESANKQYGAVQDGWRTDRGFVYVRYGEPDFIQRKPHSFNYEPYEVWIYERIGRQFIFIDKTGFGDYELLVPVWDERTRLY